MSIWLKKKDEKLLFKPDFFDFSKTKHPDGLEILTAPFCQLEKVKMYISLFDEMMNNGFKNLSLNAKELNVREKARKRAKFKKENMLNVLKKYVNSNKETAIIHQSYSPNKEMKKLVCVFSILHPWVDLSSEKFGFGFPLVFNIEQKYQEEIKKTSLELNELLLNVFEKYIEKTF